MKPFDFKYGRKQETDDEKEENVILTEDSEDKDFDSFQQEIEAAEMEERTTSGPPIPTLIHSKLIRSDLRSWNGNWTWRSSSGE
ncbi:hypothetical protein AVEN_219674-1 [Araneus ventricosus]|uniref:Uncharacterized protein n=1 Tax=Araneus ventricosus TaxID=182803 RepID=A0A4Y2RDB1_ARAVE|nr:hypothetical protein AVEN_219674-1 [Araneus ventricosus]